MMTLTHALPISLLAALVAGSELIERTASPEPTTTDAAFIGLDYDSAANSWATYECSSSSTWSAGDNGLAACCPPDGDCILWSGCKDESIVVASNRELTCTGTGRQSICIPGTVTDQPQAQTSWINYGCWSFWQSDTWHATREVPVVPSPTDTVEEDDEDSGVSHPVPASGLLLPVAFGTITLMLLG